MEYITILNFNSGTIAQLEVPAKLNTEEYELIISNKGFNLSNIEWMVHTDPKLYEYGDKL